MNYNMDVKLDGTDKSEILRYLGFGRASADEATGKYLEECIAIANDISKVRGIWREMKPDFSDEGLLSKEGLSLPGESIRKHLEGYSKVAVLAVTLGSDFDREVNRLMVTNPSKGVVLNSCGIAFTEKAADELQKIIENSLNVRTGTRFSPGYGDLPIEAQKDFIRVLDTERKIGIRLNQNMLMNPTKSVTAIVGID